MNWKADNSVLVFKVEGKKLRLTAWKYKSYHPLIAHMATAWYNILSV
jgi:hypothetical protein